MTEGKPRKRTTKPRSTPASPNGTPSLEELRELVRFRAYQLYVERGGAEGHHFDDWLRAEGEVAAAYPPAPEEKPARKAPARKTVKKPKK